MTGDVEIKCSASVESVPVPGNWVWIEEGEGESNEGKSSAPTDEGKVRREALGVGVLGEGGGEVHGVGVWKCMVGVWRLLWCVEVEGDVGGVVYPEVIVVVVGGGVDGGAASTKTRSMSSSASPTMACNARSTSNVVILVSFVPVAMKNVCKIKPGLVIFQVDLFQSKSSMSSKPKHFKPRSAATISRLSNHQSLHSRSTSPPHPAHDNASLNNHTSKGFSLLPFAGDGCTRKRVYEAGVGEEVEKHRTIWEIGLLDVDGGLEPFRSIIHTCADDPSQRFK